MAFACILIVLRIEENGVIFSSYQVPQHRFPQSQEASVQQDLVSTHLTLRAKDPLLPVCLRVFLWHSLCLLVNRCQLNAYLLKSLVLPHLPLLQGLDLPLTLLAQVPQGHLPCQAHHCLGRQLLDHQRPSLIMYPHHHLHQLCQGRTLGLPWVASMDHLLPLILLSQDTKCSRMVSIPNIGIVSHVCSLCAANWELDFRFVTCGLLAALQSSLLVSLWSCLKDKSKLNNRICYSKILVIQILIRLM